MSWLIAFALLLSQFLPPVQILKAHFGERWKDAGRVAWCESRWDNAAIGLAGERSWFQIGPWYWERYDYDRLQQDMAYAAWAASEISSGGKDWTRWSCQP